IFGLFVSPGFNDPSKNVPYLLQGGLGMPDREFYLGTDDDSVAVQNKYRTHIANVLNLAKIPNADAKAAAIYDLEKRMATVHATREESADVYKANNSWKMSEF